jgi:hypothetical protein
MSTNPVLGKYVIPDPPEPEPEPLPQMTLILHFAAFRAKHPYVLYAGDGSPLHVRFSNLPCAIDSAVEYYTRFAPYIENEATGQRSSLAECRGLWVPRDRRGWR